MNNPRQTENPIDSFYPSNYLKPWSGMPTRDKFCIQFIKGIGQCLISKVTFKPGDLVFVFSGQITNQLTLRSLKLSEHLNVHDPYFMGYVSHSCRPNCTVNMRTLTFHCIEPIKAKDQITMDYNQTETSLHQWFQCRCGNANCRGIIR